MDLKIIFQSGPPGDPFQHACTPSPGILSSNIPAILISVSSGSFPAPPIQQGRDPHQRLIRVIPLIQVIPASSAAASPHPPPGDPATVSNTRSKQH